jgi:hypothetical protein
MSKPKLYIKNDKGRYEPYQLPEPDVSDTVYRKINGKYEPVGIWEKHNWLQEGVWVVISDHSYCNGKYIKDRFRFDKVSDLQYPTIAELGGIRQAAQQAINDLGLFVKKRTEEGLGTSLYENYEFVAQRTIEILRENNK